MTDALTNPISDWEMGRLDRDTCNRRLRALSLAAKEAHDPKNAQMIQSELGELPSKIKALFILEERGWRLK
jgi:hypothetical protein